MKQYRIFIVSDNRGNKYNYEYDTQRGFYEDDTEAVVIGEGSTYEVAKKRAFKQVDQLLDSKHAEYITRWTERKRDTNSYDETWKFVGEFRRLVVEPQRRKK